jgi:hypothetical protein
MTRLARDPSDEAQEKGRQLCRFVGRGRPPHATFRRIDRRCDQNVAQARTSRAAARSYSVGPRRNRGSPARNQSISDLPDRPKDELRRAAGATKSVSNLPAARSRIFFSRLSMIGQSRHILRHVRFLWRERPAEPADRGRMGALATARAYGAHGVIQCNSMPELSAKSFLAGTQWL